MNLMQKQATKFGKHDIERLGLFSEMPYMHGQKYVPPFPKMNFATGRSMLCPRNITKCATQHGYFDNEFRRMFKGEAIEKPLKRKSKKKKQSANVTDAPFRPPGLPKWHATPGDYYGTFGGIVEAFSRVTRKQKKYVRPPPNFITCPGKKGGPGYPNICLSKYPEHFSRRPRHKAKLKKVVGDKPAMLTMHYPQPFFGPNPYPDDKNPRTLIYLAPTEKPVDFVSEGNWIPNGPPKWQAGCHAGTFSPFPTYMTNRDKKKTELKAAQKKDQAEEGAIYGPQSYALKTMFTTSILNRNTELSVNATNYEWFKSQYTKYL